VAVLIGLVSVGKDLTKVAVSVVTLCALLFFADRLIEHRPFFGRPFWALVDSGAHGLVALLVTAPLLQSPRLLILAFVAGTLVDVDHFLAAGSRSFQAATQLEKRPPTHSLTFALLVSGGGYLFSGSLTTAWIVFAALTSHVLRDASVGTAPSYGRWATGGYRGGRTMWRR